jgi:hemerythrin superfamily protein
MQSKTKTSPKGKNPDAVALLKQDHREAEGFFESFEKAKDSKTKASLAARICQALTVHMQIEEELFYPAARKATGDDDLLDEAVVEHAGAKQLIAEIEAMKVGDDLYDAKIKVLGEQIEHHVEEEEKELFPEVKKSDLDLGALGGRMASRKGELMAGQK